LQGSVVKAIKSFDVAILRIPHGWIRLANVTTEAMEQMTELVHELFRVKTILWVTLPFINNVTDYTPGLRECWTALRKANQRIRNFTKQHSAQQQVAGQQTRPGEGETKKNNGSGVLFMGEIEFGRFADSLLDWNTRLIG
jgi:hypothetical protein